jgi:hypothetical protein
MKRLRILTIILIGMFCVSIEANLAHALSWRGAHDCANWLKVRNADSEPSMKHASPDVKKVVKISMISSATAFLDGIVYARGIDYWNKPTPMSQDQFVFMIDSYCREKPLDVVYSAILDLILKHR